MPTTLSTHDRCRRPERAQARRKAPASTQPNAGASLFGGRPGGQRRQQGSTNPGAMRQRTLDRIGQQFAAFRAMLDPARQRQWDSAIASLAGARRAPLYLLAGGKPEQVQVRVGASDGTNTEVSGPIHEGDRVVVGVERTATP